MNDMVNNPPHYNDHPSGIECIEITELLPGNLAAAFKYVWRAGKKWDDLEDLKKSKWYVERTQTHLAHMDWLINSLYQPSPSVVAVLRRDLTRILKHETNRVKMDAMANIVGIYINEYGNKYETSTRAVDAIEEMINELGPKE